MYDVVDGYLAEVDERDREYAIGLYGPEPEALPDWLEVLGDRFDDDPYVTVEVLA